MQVDSLAAPEASDRLRNLAAIAPDVRLEFEHVAIDFDPFSSNLLPQSSKCDSQCSSRIDPAPLRPKFGCDFFSWRVDRDREKAKQALGTWRGSDGSTPVTHALYSE
jgi:hypothetical protein